MTADTFDLKNFDYDYKTLRLTLNSNQPLAKR